MQASRGLTPTDEHWLRVSFNIARRAAARGDQPYGAILVDGAGVALLEGENTIITTRDCTGHAETNVVREASQRFAPDVLAGATLYASAEPCVMCAGAIYWSRVGRIVYGVSADTLRAALDITGEAPAARCRDVFNGVARVQLIGPTLEDEALRVHLER